jgi:TonB family protein
MPKTESIGQRFYFWIEGIAEGVFNYWELHKVGILGTFSIHLSLLIVLLIVKLNYNATPRIVEVEVNFNNELLPITEEQKAKIEKEALAVEELLHKGLEASAIKNVAVDDADKQSNELNPSLQDDKGINASDLYREAGMVQKRLNDNKDEFSKLISGHEEIPNVPQKNTAPKDESKYKGPAVISYFLEGRKAFVLPVPSYKCQFGGQVVVDIEVNPEGKVIKATIDSSNSLNDDCIDKAAVEAATESYFTVSPNAPSRQKGSITYLFVPQ